MYNQKVLEYFLKPKNAGVIKDADGVGEAGNIVCGDLMWIYIKVREEGGKHIIEDAKFKTLGCVAAIATSSKVTELAKGKSIEEALKISKEQIVKELGGLPPVKMHCSAMAADALKEAIYDYMKRKGLKIPKELEEEHKRVEKEKKAVEERYKEFVEMQKRILGV